MRPNNLFPGLKDYVREVMDEPDKIPPNRKELLDELSSYIAKRIKKGKPVNLMFICTHNSRRSHIAQAWAQTAAYYYRIKPVRCFSGGTEATEFNRRAIAALQEAGFNIQSKPDGKNPVYTVRYADEAKPLEMYSKRWEAKENPTEDFCAIMTCSEADEACPHIPGAAKRIALTYRDPKEYDGTEHEKEADRQRTRQIARELFYVFSQI